MLLVALAMEPAAAAGLFALPWKSAKDTAMGFAAGVTEIDGPEAAYFNPAALAWLSDDGWHAGGFLAYTESEFRGQAFRAAASAPDDANYRITGSQGGNPGTASPLPDVYYGARGGPRWSWAFGSNADGFNFRYPEDWRGRYHGIETLLLLPNLQFSAGAALTDSFAFGAGLNLQFLKARFADDIDAGAAIERTGMERCLAERPDGEVTCPLLVPQGQLGGRYDFRNVLRARELTPGWLLGGLWRLDGGTLLGLSWRAPLRHRVNGSARRSRFGPGHDGRPGWDGEELRSDPDLAQLRAALDAREALTGAPGFEEQVVEPTLRNSSDARFRAELIFPETVALGLRRPFADAWLGALGLEWTRWSRLREFRAVFDTQDTVTVPLQLEDVLRVALGAQYRCTPDLLLRAGIAVEGGADDPGARAARAPDGKRRYLNMGIAWQYREDRRLDLAASLLRFEGGHVRDVAVGSGNVLEGRIQDYYALVLGARLHWE